MRSTITEVAVGYGRTHVPIPRRADIDCRRRASRAPADAPRPRGTRRTGTPSDDAGLRNHSPRGHMCAERDDDDDDSGGDDEQQQLGRQQHPHGILPLLARVSGDLGGNAGCVWVGAGRFGRLVGAVIAG